jgi:hypothetical protein
VYGDTTQSVTKKENLNERWSTIGELTHDSSSHASSNCDVADDGCIENKETNLNKRWPTIGVSSHDSSSHTSSNFDVADNRCIENEGTNLIGLPTAHYHIHLSRNSHLTTLLYPL